MKDAQHREEDLENRLSTNEKKAEAISDGSNSDDDDIPEFISIDDMLDRYLKAVPNADGVGIYKTNGILIAKKERTKNNIK